MLKPAVASDRDTADGARSVVPLPAGGGLLLGVELGGERVPDAQATEEPGDTLRVLVGHRWGRGHHLGHALLDGATHAASVTEP